MRSDLLVQIHADIDARVADIRDGRPDWPCARGCDACCHSLARLPEITRGEWQLLRQGIAALPAQARHEIRSRLEALGAEPQAPVRCPLLDAATGACPVYAHRPVACRTYGFYVQRSQGLYCGAIKARVSAGDWPDVIWGNQDALEHRLAPLGETRSLAAWFAIDPP